MAVKTQVAKWGNSLGVRIPKAYGEGPDLFGGTTIEVKRLLQAGHRLSDRPEAVLLKKKADKPSLKRSGQRF